MNKAFVNSKQISIKGTAKVEEKKVDIAKDLKQKGKKQSEIDTAVSQVTTKEMILLQDKANGVLLGICTDPSLQKTKTDITISVFDDGTEIAKVSKNYLIDACAVKRESDRLAGITYVVPLFAHAIELDYNFQNRIDAVGDISGLSFYFKNGEH